MPHKASSQAGESHEGANFLQNSLDRDPHAAQNSEPSDEQVILKVEPADENGRCPRQIVLGA